MKHGKVFPFLVALLLTLSACAGAPGNEPPEQLPAEDTMQEISETSEPVAIILDGQEITSVSAQGWNPEMTEIAPECSWEESILLEHLPADANISAALLMQNGTPLMEEAPLTLQRQDDQTLLTHGGWDGLWQQLPQPEYPDISAVLSENSTVTLTAPEGFLQCITPADAPDIARFFDASGQPYGEEAWVDRYLSPDYATLETEGGFALSLTLEVSLHATEEDGQSYAPVFICSLPVLWQAGWENTLLICNP